MSRYRFIAAEKAQYSVTQLCRVLEVAPSGIYAWRHRQPSQRALANRTLTEQIRAIHAQSRSTCGAPRVHAELRAGKKRVSRKRVARLMRVAGLVGRPPRSFRRTTMADPKVQVADLVQRSFTAAVPDRNGLATSPTSAPGRAGCTWRSSSTRTVERWWAGMAGHLRTELASAALEMALTTRKPKPGLIQHTDRGGQYTSAAYGELLSAHHARQSVGRPGTCWGYAVAESFFATLKNELIYRHVWSTRRHAELAIFELIVGW